MFWTAWSLTTVLAACCVVADLEGPALVLTVAAAGLTTATLLRSLPTPGVADDVVMPRRHLYAGAALLCVVLVLLVAALGRAIVFGLPLVGAVAWAAGRDRIRRTELVAATALAAVASAAGLGAGWIEEFPQEIWAALQFPLVLLGLLGGWALWRRLGLQDTGLAPSRLAAGRMRVAPASAVSGILLSAPWALTNLALAAEDHDAWATEWWSPLAALQPGIAEEAWGRVLLVPVAVAILRPSRPGHRVVTVVAVVVAFWFAYLHAFEQDALSAAVSTLLIGALFSLPVTFLWLRRDLETAIGWHIGVDMVRIGGAYVASAGLWG